MSEQLVRTLRRLKIDRMVEKGEARMARDAALIFFAVQGTPLDEGRLRKAFSQALRRAKLSSFRLYDLHHTVRASCSR